MKGNQEIYTGNNMELYNENSHKAFNLFLEQAQEENADRNVQCKLAILYHKGYGTDKNEKQALYWFRQSAGKGNHHALRDIGVYHEHGYGGLQQNYGKALKYYTEADKLNKSKEEKDQDKNLNELTEKDLRHVRDLIKNAWNKCFAVKDENERNKKITEDVKKLGLPFYRILNRSTPHERAAELGYDSTAQLIHNLEKEASEYKDDKDMAIKTNIEAESTEKFSPREERSVS